MGTITRRGFIAAGAAALALPGAVGTVGPKRALAYEYSPSGKIEYSDLRRAHNRIEAALPKAQVVKVRDHVWSAVGYALANIVMVETPEGLVIIDTTESKSVAEQVRGEFNKITNKPVKKVIYTHHHTDHYRGTAAFFQEGVEVIAQDGFSSELKRFASLGKSASSRAVGMFAIMLQPKEKWPWISYHPEPSASVLRFEQLKPADLIMPTRTFKDRYSFKLGGITFNLTHTPGETSDQISVEIPEYQTVCCADNFYGSFPNLYTIRGTSQRPVLDWAKAQDTYIALAPEHLVPCHGLPLKGREDIKTVLGNYRDAIIHVHDHALKAVQDFIPVDEAAATVALPQRLAGLPYLTQGYGYLPYCVRNIYASYVGWFDGDPVNLNPLSRKDLGAEILALAGSADKVLAQADSALKKGRYQAALELTEMVLTNDPSNIAARRMKSDALDSMSAQSINKPTINYYHWSATVEKRKLKSLMKK